MNKTAKIVLAVVAGIVLFVLFIYLPGIPKYNSILASEVADAISQLEKSPPGIRRIEEFVARLRAIEFRKDTPADTRQALADYTATMEEAVVAMATGRDVKSYDQKLADERKRLLATLRK